MNASPGPVKAYRALKRLTLWYCGLTMVLALAAYLGSWRLTLDPRGLMESWRLTLWPWVWEAHSRAMDAYPDALRVILKSWRSHRGSPWYHGSPRRFIPQHGALEEGVDTHSGPFRLTLKPRKLTMKPWRLNMETDSQTQPRVIHS
jgi:hypothetical protein